MKWIIHLSLIVLCMFSLDAQYYYQPDFFGGNPGHQNIEDDGAYNWQPIMPGNHPSTPWSGVYYLPFAFTFYGDTVTAFRLSNEGLLTFDTTIAQVQAGISRDSLPSNKLPSRTISLWGLEIDDPYGRVRSKVFGSAPNRQFWITFMEAPILGAVCYWSIVFEESSNIIHLVDQFTDPRGKLFYTYVSAGIQNDSLTGIGIPGSPYAKSLARNINRFDNHYHSFIPGVQPSIGIELSELLIDSPLDSSKGSSLPFNFANTGKDTIHNLTVGYSINKGPNQTVNFANLSIPTFEIDTLNLGSWAPKPNTYVIELWIDSINDNQFNGDSIVRTVSVGRKKVLRIPMAEVFTASTCPPSHPYDYALDQFFTQNKGKQTHIKYPYKWNYPGDPYYTYESEVRAQFYNINSIPHGIFNGLEHFVSSYNIPSNSYLQSLYDDSCFVSLDVSRSVSNKSIQVDINLGAEINLTDNHLVLYTAVYEIRTVNNNTPNGTTEFRNIMKKFIPNAKGIPIGDLTTGDSVNYNLQYHFNGNYRLPAGSKDPIDHSIEHSVEDFNALDVAVWIQDTITHEIIQSAHTNNGVSSNIGVSLPTSDLFKIRIFPNPASDFITILLDKNYSQFNLELVNMQGKVVKQSINENSIKVDDLPRGSYLLTINLESRTYLREVILE